MVVRKYLTCHIHQAQQVRKRRRLFRAFHKSAAYDIDAGASATSHLLIFVIFDVVARVFLAAARDAFH